MASGTRKIVDVLNGKTVSPPPIWLMRQAGRYLPEYRETRAKAGSFLDLCYSPEHAVEVTLQPIRRYGFDAAILFSDILVIPDALKRQVRFDEGHGPRMQPLSTDEIPALAPMPVMDHLQPVIETVRRLRVELPAETALLGFCGAPWTVATYMIAGHGTPDQAPTRLFAYREPKAFAALLDILAEKSAEYLVAQIDAGADAVQIFNSWAGVLGEHEFAAYAVKPVRRIVDLVRAQPTAGEDHRLCERCRTVAEGLSAGHGCRCHRARLDCSAVVCGRSAEGRAGAGQSRSATRRCRRGRPAGMGSMRSSRRSETVR